MKDIIIIALLVVIVMVIISRRMSGMSPSPSNCGSKTILKDANCRKVYSDVYPRDGPIVGDRKYCCA